MKNTKDIELMIPYFPNVENRSLICSQFIKWQMEFIYKKMTQE